MYILYKFLFYFLFIKIYFCQIKYLRGIRFVEGIRKSFKTLYVDKKKTGRDRVSERERERQGQQGTGEEQRKTDKEYIYI